MIKKLIGSKGPSTKQSGIPVSMDLRFIRGDFQQLKKDFPYLVNKNTVQVDKLGFPDVILPGEGRGFVAVATVYVHVNFALFLLLLLFTGRDRNDIYLTLEYGQFEKGSKRAERNVEIAIAVCDKGGNIIPVSNTCTHTCTCRFMPCT